MGSIRARSDSNHLFIDFYYKNQRCREQTALKDTPANRKRLKTVLSRIEAEISLGVFDYEKTFPDSANLVKYPQLATNSEAGGNTASSTPLFKQFAMTWFHEKQVEWRASYIDTIQGTLNLYLLPKFGDKEVGSITKAEILAFRATLAKVRAQNAKPLSASRINRIMTPLRMILNEAANRYEFTPPFSGIKSLKVPKTDVQPFSIEEVKLFIGGVRRDFRNYYTVRFFTGLRTGEIDGLQWKYVDFERQQILIRESLVNGMLGQTKNDGSYRTIDMSAIVKEALESQKKVTGNQQFVFCNTKGLPLSHNNVTKRVWYPTLRYLEMTSRRPYQTRHTAATLWLASGESPEWIARQMGHTNTEMLFRVYSRYVPNLTRKDGSAMERLLASHLTGKGSAL